jgi:NADH:ubiquinone oxidoreductase subunit F (NADH-binding)
VIGYVVAPAGFVAEVAVAVGPRLLAGVVAGSGLGAHRRVWPDPPPMSGRALLDLVQHVDIRGRGGAGFPFARKLQTVLDGGKRRALIVNGSEGEPGSAKDSALLTTVPHLVLDGAEVAARAVGAREIDVVVPGERRAVAGAVATALDERDAGFTYRLHETAGGFVGGQSRAVVELLEGRENLPVTGWVPDAVKGLRGRPTLLSNAETYAQVAALAAMGPDRYSEQGLREEPGTTLLTVAGDGPNGVVLEVGFGTPLAEVLRLCGFPPDSAVLMGGYHGAWLPPHETATRRVSRTDLTDAGVSLGAGVVLPLDEGACPVTLTARVVEYLAGQSALRCGPCRNGLPALAEATALLADEGAPGAVDRMIDVADTVTGRGACAHPDGTVRLVRSLLRTFPEEVAAHQRRRCRATAGEAAR